MSGKLTLDGTEVLLKGVDLHGYAVVADGRVHVSVSPIPEKVGWALMTVSPLIGLFGWLFSQELQDYKNGFHLTGMSKPVSFQFVAYNLSTELFSDKKLYVCCVFKVASGHIKQE